MSKRKQTPDVLAEILGGERPGNGESLGTAARSRTRSTSQPELAEPQQWEYRVVTFQEYKGWRPRFLNGRELRDWMGGPLIHEYLAMIGEEGWELAAASAGERLYGNADNHQLYFKKPKGT